MLPISWDEPFNHQVVVVVLAVDSRRRRGGEKTLPNRHN